MIDHVSITVVDLQRSMPFYDAVFAALGVVKVGSDDNWAGFGLRADASQPGRSYLSIRGGETLPISSQRHWCFKAPSPAAVDRFHQAGLAAGGRDDGPPGLRPDYHPSYYAAFLLDPDGNRIEAVCHLEAY